MMAKKVYIVVNQNTRYRCGNVKAVLYTEPLFAVDTSGSVRQSMLYNRPTKIVREARTRLRVIILLVFSLLDTFTATDMIHHQPIWINNIYHVELNPLIFLSIIKLHHPLGAQSKPGRNSCHSWGLATMPWPALLQMEFLCAVISPCHNAGCWCAKRIIIKHRHLTSSLHIIT